jgi:hypothetical protein
MSGGRVQEPDKELRFTRAGQAVGFWMAAAVLITAGIILLAVSVHRPDNPRLPHGAWALPPLALALAAVRWAVRLTRHAYLLVTPLGIEIFPFFRPAAGMRMVLWQEIDSAEVNAANTLLTLHFNPEKTAGLHLTLRPVMPGKRELVALAVTGRLAERGAPRE